MHFSQLEYLIEISQQPTLYAASERLHITPQALSLSIKNLEKELDVQLLDRSFRGVHLTSEGEQFLLFATQTLENLLVLQKNFSEQKTSLTKELCGTLTIYSNSLFFESLLSEKIKQYKILFPNVTVSAFIYEDIHSAQILQEHYYEEDNIVGILLLPCEVNGEIVSDFLPPNTLNFIPFEKTSYYALVSKDSPLAKYEIVSIKKLLAQPMILYRSRNSNITTPILYLLEQYATPQVSLVTSSLPIFLESISSGLGIGYLNELHFLATSSLKSRLDNTTIIKIKEPFLTRCCIATTKNISEITKQFLNLFHV